MIRGVLFDLDGTLADTERLQWAAYRSVLVDSGVDVGLEEYSREFILSGAGPEYACRTYRLRVGPDELRRRKAIAYRRLIEEGVVPLPGALDALARLRGSHRLAVATNSTRDEARVVLGHIRAAALLDAVVTREDYARAKPAPDAYLAAARALGLAPMECAIVEDTPRGVAAGRAAGMAVIAVPNDLTRGGDFGGATCRLGGLDALTPALLARLGGG